MQCDIEGEAVFEQFVSIQNHPMLGADYQKITNIWFINQKIFEFFFHFEEFITDYFIYFFEKTFFETFWNVSAETKSVRSFTAPYLSNGYYPGSTCAVCSKFLSINDLIF